MLPLGVRQISVNGQSLSSFFGGHWDLRYAMLSPFVKTNTSGLYSMMATVKGGGKSGASHVRFYPISFPYALHDARVLPATCFARCAASISVVRWLGFKLRSLLPQSSPPVARLM